MIDLIGMRPEFTASVRGGHGRQRMNDAPPAGPSQTPLTPGQWRPISETFTHYGLEVRTRFVELIKSFDVFHRGQGEVRPRIEQISPLTQESVHAIRLLLDCWRCLQIDLIAPREHRGVSKGIQSSLVANSRVSLPQDDQS